MYRSAIRIKNCVRHFRTSTIALEGEGAPLGGAFKNLPFLPEYDSIEEEQERKKRLAASFRLFAKLGFDEGVAGHITARDPIDPLTFWVNPFGMHFSMIKPSDLIRVDHDGNIVEGVGLLNAAAFAIHSEVHAARPDVNGVAHTHAPHGRAFSILNKKLSSFTQDSCAFHNDHALYDDYGGVVVDLDEGKRIAKALGQNKAAILRNHGLITVGETVDSAAWWYIAMERSCQVQLLAESASNGSELVPISEEAASQAATITGSPYAGWFQFQPLYASILHTNPDLISKSL